MYFKDNILVGAVGGSRDKMIGIEVKHELLTGWLAGCSVYLGLLFLVRDRWERSPGGKGEIHDLYSI